MCFFKNSGDKLILFTEEILNKIRRNLKLRKEHNAKFKDVLPEKLYEKILLAKINIKHYRGSMYSVFIVISFQYTLY